MMCMIGECKDVMKTYLGCMRKVRGMNDPECRDLAKAYLACRMDRWVNSLCWNNAGTGLGLEG
jgi:hypothetical protein